jgi:hypothetical protein
MREGLEALCSLQSIAPDPSESLYTGSLQENSLGPRRPHLGDCENSWNGWVAQIVFAIALETELSTLVCLCVSSGADVLEKAAWYNLAANVCADSHGGIQLLM